MSEQEQNTLPATPADQEVNASPSAPTPAARPSSAPSGAAPLLMGVKLPIRVLLGRTELSLRDIAQLGSGAVVELDCSPDDPVEIIVNDRIIAHGQVVVVAGNYGVRITKIAARGEDPRTEDGATDLASLSDQLR